MKNLKGNKMISIVLVFAMLFVTLIPSGVPAFAGEIIEVKTQEELKAALNKNTKVDEINITESFTVNEDCKIMLDPEHINNYYDVMLKIANGVTLTIEEGGEIGSFWPSYKGDWETPPVPDTKVINNGTVIVEKGGATVADFNTNNGTITVKDGGEAVVCANNNGTVTVESGGKYFTTQGCRAENNGTVNIQNGAEMRSRFGSEIINEVGGTINLNGWFYVGCIGDNGNDGFWFENNGTMTGNGDIILYQADSSVLPVTDMDGLIKKMMDELGQTTRFENWEDINIFKLEEVSDYQQLKALMTADRTIAGEHVEGNMDTLVEFKNNIEIPGGEEIGAMTRITVPEGVKLTINNGAIFETGVINNGTVEVKSGGKFATTMGGMIENHGVLTVDKNAQIKSQMGGEIVNCEGGRLTVNGTLYCGFIHINENNTDLFWFENSGWVCGEGKFFFYNPHTDESDIIPCSEIPTVAQQAVNMIGETAGLNDTYIQFDHLWGPWVEKKAPSCVPGEATVTCGVCGKTVVKAIPACKAHTLVTLKAVAPTFTKTGKTAGKKCSKCGKVITAQKAVAKLVSPSLSKVSASKKAFTAKWSKFNVDGYELRYSLKKNMKKSNTVKLKKSLKSKKISNLKSKKVYYVQIRGYKKINGKKVYSSWSAKKKVTVK